MKHTKAKKTPDAPRQASMHRLTLPHAHASQARDLKRGKPTPEHPLLISATEVSEFLRCRVRHHWGSQMQLTTVKPNVPMSMGTVGHATLETWYKVPPSKRTTKAMRLIAAKLIRGSTLKELTTGDRELLTAMVTGYADWCMDSETEHNDPLIGLVQCMPEAWFDEKLVPDGSIRVRGKIDNLFESTTRRKTVGMLESKFKGQIRETEDNRVQDNVYLWAMRKRFPKMKRYSLYYQILRKQLPGPRVTAPLYSRDLVERTDDEVEQFEIDLRNIALDMVDGAVYPNRNGQCQWDCDFKVPCLLRGTPDDLEHVLSTEFVKKAPR
jgi:hypothetical protein